MIEQRFYKLSELTHKWGYSEDDLLHLADTGRLQLTVEFCVPEGVQQLQVTASKMSEQYEAEDRSYHLMAGTCGGLFMLTQGDAMQLDRCGEADLLNAYTLDGDMVVFNWPTGTRFTVTRENVGVLSSEAEDIPLIGRYRLQDLLERSRNGDDDAKAALVDELLPMKTEEETWLAKWEAIGATTPGDIDLKAKRIREKRSIIATLDRHIKVLRGDTHV